MEVVNSMVVVQESMGEVVVGMADKDIVTKSTHRVEVVPVTLEPHPNPDIDTLSVVKVWEYQVCVKTADWEGVDKGAYIVPDSVVPNNEMFKWLDGHTRIKVRKFGGAWSQGLLVPAPDGSEIGDDVAEQLGVVRYIHPSQVNYNHGEPVRLDDVPMNVSMSPKYDVDSWHRYAEEFVDGELVVVTEKIHGANIRFTFDSENDRVLVGSHSFWRKDEGIFYECLKQNSWVEDFCRAYPNYIFFGEMFGHQRGFNYGHPNVGDRRLRLFDVWDKVSHRYLDWKELFDIKVNDTLISNYWVPVVYWGVYDKELVRNMSTGNSLIEGTDHVREGVVVAPEVNRVGVKSLDRVKLKIVNNDYYHRAGQKNPHPNKGKKGDSGGVTDEAMATGEFYEE